MTRWRPLLAFVLGAAASVLNFIRVEDFDVGEISGGSLTGPMIFWSFNGSLVLLVGAIIQIWRPRIGAGISIVGVAMMLPLFSWFFAAGWWCSGGTCKIGYPWLFRFDLPSAAILALTSTSIALQWRRR